MVEARRESVSLKRGRPNGLPSVACLSAGDMLVMCSIKAFRARIQACSLNILEKANRSQGRDAKPRAGWKRSVARLPKG
jgi:hypothetical protein